MWRQLILGFLLCGLAASAEIPQYKNFKVYDVVPTDNNQAQFLYELSETDSSLDFWSLARAVNLPARVMVPPQNQTAFEEILQRNQIEYSVINKDVSKTIARSQGFTSRRSSGEVDFTRYLRFHEINAYLETLAAQYPGIVKVETVGTSYEERPLKTITIGNGKNVIFIDAGIHAREWIAPAGALYVIQQLVEKSTENQHLLKNFSWKILPLVNPDGYEYTHTNERFWRKTRSHNRICRGTDGNRNFNFHWAEVGTSTSECSETYHGQQPFSEPETKIVRDIMHSVSGPCKMYLSLHSYGNYLLYPWGWTSALPSTWRDIDDVARAGANAVRKATGSKYTVGSSTNVLYPAAGGSDDYAFAKAGIPIAMTMELPSGGNGFDPHPSQIKRLVLETWIAIKAMAEKVAEKYN